jgi:hypothetical protein
MIHSISNLDLNSDFAIGNAYKHSMRFMSALSIKLMVIKIVLNSSVKISHLAALKDREN